MFRVKSETDIFNMFLYSGELAVARICAEAAETEIMNAKTKISFFIRNKIVIKMSCLITFGIFSEISGKYTSLL